MDAIEFRMDQANLTRKDLVQYIGSASKVPEVLNRKRPLSLSMIRALREGLGIPAEVLLQAPGKKLPPAHVKLHLQPAGPCFFDEIDNGASPEDDPAEQQADALARSMLIPDALWAQKGPALCTDPQEWLVVEVAEQLGLSPAILAGRIRRELRNYTILASLVGNGEVRRLFPDLYKP